MNHEKMKSDPFCAYQDGGGILYHVWLPELTRDYHGNISQAMQDRAADALSCALPQLLEIYMDGEDKPPAIVSIEPWNLNDKYAWEIEG